jgi:hypothetical protein
MENNQAVSELGNLLPVDLYEKIQKLTKKNSHSMDIEVVRLLRNAVEQESDSSHQALPTVGDTDPKEATMNAAGSITDVGIARL